MDWTQQAGAMAENYDAFLAPGMFEPCARILLDAADVRPGQRVLDMACGTGVVSRAAAARGASVTAIDMAAAMLDRARQHNAERIEYLEGDAAALPVGDATFDVAVCQHGFQFFPDRPAVLGELMRALEPGGTVAIACWSRFDDTPSFVALERAIREHIGGETAAAIRMPTSVSAEDLAALLEGLDDVSVEDAEVPTAFVGEAEDLAEKFMLANPLAGAYLALDEDRREAYRSQVAGELARFERDGVFSPPMYTTIATARKP
jgi:SAM-dependent methyltransferase